jgi:small multidrug resistance pump
MKGEGVSGWLYLLLAIGLELAGTISMKYSAGFTRLWPSVLMFVCYGASFTFLNFALRHMVVSLAYAVWSGVGIVLITLAGSVLFKQHLTWASVIWIGVIVAGVVGLNISVNSHQ